MIQIWSDIVSFAICSHLQFVRIRVHLHFSIDVEKMNARIILHPTYDDDGTGVPSTHAEKRKRESVPWTCRDELKEIDDLNRALDRLDRPPRPPRPDPPVRQDPPLSVLATRRRRS